MVTPSIAETIRRIQADYVEMPGLMLTLNQARRLWNLPLGLCESALTTLVSSGFLRQTPKGEFLRTSFHPAATSASV